MAVVVNEGRLVTVNSPRGFFGQGRNAAPAGTFRQGNARWTPLHHRDGGKVEGWGDCISWSYLELACRQPAVRTVVSAKVEAVSHLPARWYTRDGNNTERLDDNDELVQLTDEPVIGWDFMQWLEELLWDLCIFGNCYVLKWRAKAGDRLQLLPLPPELVTHGASGLYGPREFLVGSGPDPMRFSHEDVMHIAIPPRRNGRGESLLKAAADSLAEEYAARQYRRSQAEQGWSMAGYITRPTDAPELSNERIERLEQRLGKTHGGAGNAGKVALLEDGMEYAPANFKPNDLEYLEVRKLTLLEIAQIYGVPPGQVGISGEGTNTAYAAAEVSVRSWYENSLATTIKRICGPFTRCMREEFGRDDRPFFELDFSAKLASDPLEQMKCLTMASGRPLMTTDEAREQINLPPIPGGDELITPLNVAVGGQVVPGDQFGQRAEPVQLARKAATELHVKAIERGDEAEAHEAVLSRTFARQKAIVLKAIGDADAVGDAFDRARFDRELGEDLATVTLATAAAFYTKWAADLGIDDTADFAGFADIEGPQIAEVVNAKTAEAVADNLGDRDGMAAWFDEHNGKRAKAIAAQSVSVVAGFTGEAAGTAAGLTHKRWVPTGTSDRHPPIPDRVELGSKFSNGGRWPGEGQDTHGCKCVLVID